ncbi:MAG: hypothetical protein QMD32_01155, partial [Smithellaceae bacterium]|nr:hypothetical protein [Smithellaceae bacterium]
VFPPPFFPCAAGPMGKGQFAKEGSNNCATHKFVADPIKNVDNPKSGHVYISPQQFQKQRTSNNRHAPVHFGQFTIVFTICVVPERSSVPLFSRGKDTWFWASGIR